MNARRWQLAVVFAVLVVTAGCSGAPPGQPESTETAGETATPTATSAPAETPTPGGAVDDPTQNMTALQAAHEAHLREQGSFTFRRNATVSGSGVNDSQRRVGRFDLDNGAALVVERPLVGSSPRTTYLAPNGSAYERWPAGDEVRYTGPELTRPPNVTSALQFGTGLPPGELPWQYEGHASHAGVEGHVYTSTDAGAFGAAADGFNDSEIVDVEVALVLAEAGYVKYHSIDLSFEVEDGQRTYRIVHRYEDVGRTTVSEPDWLDEAIATVPTPTPEGPENRTFELSDDRGRVEETVTAPRGSYWGDAGPEHTGSHEFSYGHLMDASVGPVVRLHWPDGATRIEATFHYEESQLPRDDERALTVVVYDREQQRLRPVDDVDGVSATVGAEANTVTGVVTGEAALDRYQGNAFFAMDYEYFSDSWPPE